MYNKNNNYKGHNKNSKYNNRGGYKDKYKKREKSIEEHEHDYIAKKRNIPGEKPLCPICDKEIYLIEEAIKHKETGKLAHFDCILKILHEDNEIESSENIVYLGGGSFGIIKERQSRGLVKFFVRKRIMYEDRENINIKEDDKEN